MPSLATVRSAVAELPNGPPLVAALAGGTTGIGSYVARALARAFAKNGSKLRVYIVGRNASRAESVIAEGRRLSPDSDWRFVQATDLALMSEVDRSCAEIIRQETEAPFHGGQPRLDLLYMSHCYPILKERTSKLYPRHTAEPPNADCFSSKATKEGLDAFISTVYYSRIRFTMQLAPLLTASPRAGHVVSIYAGGFEDGAKPGEMLIGCPPPSTYGVNGVRKHTSFMKTFVFEELAEKHAGHLSLTHIYPGLVDGPGFYSPEMPTWFRIVWRIMKPLAKLYMTSAEDCGDIMVYLATARYPAKGTLEQGGAKTVAGGVEVAKSTLGEIGGGAYGVGQKGDVAAKGKAYEKMRKEGLSKEIWDHTMETFARAEKENAKTS